MTGPGECRSVIVGFGFLPQPAKAAFLQMREGDQVALDRRPENGGNDPNGVACRFLGMDIGWLPRAVNPAVAAAIDAGREVRAVCTRAPEADARGRLKVEPMLRVTWE